ncbi:MAG TPA: LysR family transcriptional regulator [Geobacter sp.]|nr:LysR family transcriptional regulator [Geobacter sp.]
MDLINLKTLVESVKEGSFSKAAESLCVTQSAVSRRIKILEDHYGHQLVDRSGLVLKPTPAGQLLVEKARQLLKLEQELVRDLEILAQKRKISFCCTAPFGISYLPAIFTRFMASHVDASEVNFVFEMPETALKGLRENLFDLVLIEFCEDLNLDEFSVYPLTDDEMVFVSSPGFPLGESPVRIETMLPQRLYCKKSGCCARRFLEKSMSLLGRDAMQFSNTVFFDDVPFIIRAVMAGEGITLISRSIVAAHLEEGTLVAHHIEGFKRSRPRRLVLPKERGLDPLLIDFIGEIFDSFSLPLPASLSASS